MTDKEINEAVARKLGWYETTTVLPKDGIIQELPAWTKDDKFVLLKLPDYVNSIEAAWEIVEHLQNLLSVSYFVSMNCKKDKVEAGILCALTGNIAWEAEADTAPRAICLAFLKMQ